MANRRPTYTELRDFLDGYTTADGDIQGDPSTIAAEAVAAGLATDDEQRVRQHPEYSPSFRQREHERSNRQQPKSDKPRLWGRVRR